MMRSFIRKLTAFTMTLCLSVACFSFTSAYVKRYDAYALTSNDYSLSQNGVEFICSYEGFNPTCYRDNTQQSIGYGSKCGDGTLHTAGTHSITKEEALELMISKIDSEYAPHVRAGTKGLEMTQNQFDALCSMCYNTWQIQNSPLVRYLRGEISEETARAENAEYRICKGTVYESGLRKRRIAEANLFFKDAPSPVLPTPSDGCFQPCGSGYTSIVEALKSIGADSSYAYRAKIAAANGISGYSGTAAQNTQMLNMLKAGTLKVPSSGEENNVPDPPPVVDYSEIYFPACSSGFTSLVDALKSIGVDSSYSYRSRIAEKNGISGYSGTAAQNTQMLTLLKSGKLVNPDGKSTDSDTSGKYFPACSSSASSLVDALKEVGADSSYSYRSTIAEKNGISGYSGTAAQNTQMLTLLKSGMLVRPEYVEAPEIVNYTVSLDANGGSSPISSMTIASNSVYNGLPTASREGYTFIGWYTGLNDGTQVVDGNGLVSACDHILYAHWRANTYTVSFDNNDGSGITASKTVSYGDSYGELTEPTRTGYTFLGWYTTSNEGTIIHSSDLYTNADNQTLYAHWEANSYLVSFDVNGGKGSVSSKSVEYDDVYGELQEVERAGYNFMGWFTAKEGGQQITGESRVTIFANQTLYAQWEEITASASVVSGDCNDDGKLTISDAVLLQKWLLNDAKLIHRQAADLNEDGKLNAFDLCLLKYKIING